MAGAKTYDRMRRLEALAARLKEDRPCTLQALAAEHGVSTRTIARDLDIMRDQGMPIEAERGRGGGLRLDRRWGVGRLSLAYTEAVDLLIGIDVAEKMQSPIFLGSLASVRRQLLASFSPDKRRKVDQLKARIVIGVTASTFVQNTINRPADPVIQALHQAFMDQEILAIRYQREDGKVTKRDIEPHYLLLKYPVWYVVAIDHLRGTERVFRCDRIQQARLTGTGFSLRPIEAFSESLADGELRV